jgi:hypothetical protein
VALGNTELHAAIKAVVNLAGIDQIFSLAPTQTKAFHREVLLPQPTSTTSLKQTHLRSFQLPLVRRPRSARPWIFDRFDQLRDYWGKPNASG